MAGESRTVVQVDENESRDRLLAVERRAITWPPAGRLGKAREEARFLRSALFEGSAWARRLTARKSLALPLYFANWFASISRVTSFTNQQAVLKSPRRAT